MKKFLTLIVVFYGIVANAQINITAYMPDDIKDSYPNAAELLESKLNNVLSSNNIKSQMGDSRFILTGNWVTESKDIVGSAPTQIAYVLDINLYIGDGQEGTKYASETFRVKGVGATEEKARIAAIRNLQSKSAKIDKLIKSGRDRIMSYYETNKEQLLASANSLIADQNYDEAIYQLYLIPMECSYYLHVQSLLEKACRLRAKRQAEIEQRNYEMEREKNRLEASVEKARIEADAKNYAQEQMTQREKIKQTANVASRIVSASERLLSQRIAAVRDIATTYAKNCPRTIVYRVNNWY